MGASLADAIEHDVASSHGIDLSGVGGSSDSMDELSHRRPPPPADREPERPARYAVADGSNRALRDDASSEPLLGESCAGLDGTFAACSLVVFVVFVVNGHFEKGYNKSQC